MANKRTLLSAFPQVGEAPPEKVNWDSDEEEFIPLNKRQKVDDEANTQPNAPFINFLGADQVDDELNDEPIHQCDEKIAKAKANLFLSSAPFNNWARLFFCRIKFWIPRIYLTKDETQFKNQSNEEDFNEWIQNPDNDWKQMMWEWERDTPIRKSFGKYCSSDKNSFITEFVCPKDTDAEHDPIFYATLVTKYYLERKDHGLNYHITSMDADSALFYLLKVKTFAEFKDTNEDDQEALGWEELRTDFYEWLRGDYGSDSDDSNWDQSLTVWINDIKCTPVLVEDKAIPRSFETFLAQGNFSILFF